MTEIEVRKKPMTEIEVGERGQQPVLVSDCPWESQKVRG